MDYNNKPDGYYNNVRQEMLAYLPANAKKVLDVGCGNGAFAATIKTKNSAEVWGIEYMDEEAKQAGKEKKIKALENNSSNAQNLAK